MAQAIAPRRDYSHKAGPIGAGRVTAVTLSLRERTAGALVRMGGEDV